MFDLSFVHLPQIPQSLAILAFDLKLSFGVPLPQLMAQLLDFGLEPLDPGFCFFRNLSPLWWTSTLLAVPSSRIRITS